MFLRCCARASGQTLSSLEPLSAAGLLLCSSSRGSRISSSFFVLATISLNSPCLCEEGAMKEGAQEISGEGAQHLAMHVFILALSLLQ